MLSSVAEVSEDPTLSEMSCSGVPLCGAQVPLAVLLGVCQGSDEDQP